MELLGPSISVAEKEKYEEGAKEDITRKILWIPMDSHEILWTPRDSYGFLENLMDSYVDS